MAGEPACGRPRARQADAVAAAFDEERGPSTIHEVAHVQIADEFSVSTLHDHAVRVEARVDTPRVEVLVVDGGERAEAPERVVLGLLDDELGDDPVVLELDAGARDTPRVVVQVRQEVVCPALCDVEVGEGGAGLTRGLEVVSELEVVVEVHPCRHIEPGDVDLLQDDGRIGSCEQLMGVAALVGRRREGDERGRAELLAVRGGDEVRDAECVRRERIEERVGVWRGDGERERLLEVGGVLDGVSSPGGGRSSRMKRKAFIGWLKTISIVASSGRPCSRSVVRWTSRDGWCPGAEGSRPPRRRRARHQRRPRRGVLGAHVVGAGVGSAHVARGGGVRGAGVLVAAAGAFARASTHTPSSHVSPAAQPRPSRHGPTSSGPARRRTRRAGWRRAGAPEESRGVGSSLVRSRTVGVWHGADGPRRPVAQVLARGLASRDIAMPRCGINRSTRCATNDLSARPRGAPSSTRCLAVAGVALAVTAFLPVVSVAGGFVDAFRDRVLGVNAHLVVMKNGVYFGNYAEVAGEIQALDGVDSTAPSSSARC